MQLFLFLLLSSFYDVNATFRRFFAYELQESVSAARSYDEFGMYTLSGMHEGPASYSLGMGMGGSMSMGMGRGGRGYRRMRSSAPDLPSLLLDSRIIFLGMPVRLIFHLISLFIYYLEGLGQQMVTFYFVVILADCSGSN